MQAAHRRQIRPREIRIAPDQIRQHHGVTIA